MVSNTRSDMEKALKTLKAKGQIDQLKLQIKEREHKMLKIKNERDHLKAENTKLRQQIAELEKKLEK